MKSIHGGDIYNNKVNMDFSVNINPLGIPHSVKEAMSDALSYAERYPNMACSGLKKAISEYFTQQSCSIQSEDVIPGNGASELFMAIAHAIKPKKAVLLAPGFFGYEHVLRAVGCDIGYFLLDEQSDFSPAARLDALMDMLTDDTDIFFIANPNNPTGALYPREVLQQIVDVAREHELMIFSDEIYDRLVMDDYEHVSIASLAPDLFCVTFSGLSKSHMIAGYRIGWMVLSGNKALGKDYIEGLNMLSNMRLCSNVPAQSIVQTALGGYQSVGEYIVPGGRIYEQREYVYKALNDIPGISAVKPKAAFYIFPKIDTARFNITNDEQFALDLLREKKILIIHGGGFNWDKPDHFRVVYLPRTEILKDATGKLADFLSSYKQK